MKKIVIILVMILAIIEPVYANEENSNRGSLKIDTTIEKNIDQKDITHLEQETELSRLFSSDTTNKIVEIKKTEALSFINDKALFFLKNNDYEKISNQYRTILFSEKNNNTIKKVSLKNKQNNVSLLEVVFICVGVAIMCLTIAMYAKNRRNINNEQVL